MEDRIIVELFQIQANEAIFAFDQKYGAALFKRAYAILNSVEDSEECVNECYLKMWQCVPSQLRKSDSLFAYSYAIISNIARNMLRKKEMTFYVELSEERILCEKIKDPIERMLNMMILKDSILEICKESNEKCMRVIKRRYIKNESIRRIADEEGLSEASVKMYCKRFKQKVAKNLTKNGMQY